MLQHAPKETTTGSPQVVVNLGEFRMASAMGAAISAVKEAVQLHRAARYLKGLAHLLLRAILQCI